MNSLSDTYAELDSVNYSDLYRLINSDIKEKGKFSLALAERLDKLFTVKLVRLLRSPATGDSDIQHLDNLIARISRDSYRDELNSFPAHYASRWRSLRDVLAISLQIDAYNTVIRESSNDQSPNAWEFLAKMVTLAGDAGVRWTDAKDAVIASELGPRTKGGVSQMISTMRAHGWIDAIQSGGQRLTLVPGRNIAKSRSWQQLRGGAVIKAASDEYILTNLSSLSSKSSEISRKAVSLNQGAFLDYSHLANECHRQLRQVLERSLHSAHNESSLYRHMESLDVFLEARFKTVAKHNFDLLQEYFADRSDVGPRVCIIGCWQTDENEPVFVSPIIRDASVGYDAAAEVNDNSGFGHVINSGKYYLNNNLVKTALSGRYRNPRFDYDAIHDLQGRLTISDIEHERGVTPEIWREIWRDSSTVVDVRSFYRSTLIVPLTLRNENLSAEFNKSLSLRLHKSNNKKITPVDYDQTILGFLCFDHPDTDYFHSEHDVNTAYVFASLLSMYIFKRISLTTLSNTYHKAVKEIRKLQDNQVKKPSSRVKKIEPPPVLPSPNLDLKEIRNSNIYSLERKSFNVEGM